MPSNANADSFTVSGGSVTLDGTLDVTCFGEFTGSVGETYDVIQSQAGNISGSIATTNLPSGSNFSQSIVGNYYQLRMLQIKNKERFLRPAAFGAVDAKKSTLAAHVITGDETDRRKAPRPWSWRHREPKHHRV